MNTQNTPQTLKFKGSDGFHVGSGLTNVDGDPHSVRVTLELVNPTKHLSRHFIITVKTDGKRLNGPDDFGCTLKEAKIEALRLLEEGFTTVKPAVEGATKRVELECALDVPVETKDGEVVAVMLSAADWDVLRALIAANPAVEAQMKAAGIMKTEVCLDLDTPEFL